MFSGVGKTAEEIDAALAAGIFAFNCESEPELALVDALAHRRGIKARVALRVNPDVDADTHAYISTGSLGHKFGIDIGEAEAVYERARQLENLLLEGVSCHIGSQQFDFEPMMQAADRVLELIALSAGQGLRHPPCRPRRRPGRRLQAGRAGSAHRRVHGGSARESRRARSASVPGTRAIDRRQRGRAADARSLSQEKRRQGIRGRGCRHERPDPPGALRRASRDPSAARDVSRSAGCAPTLSGPVCESGDFLAQDRQMPEVFPGDLLAVCTAGAYGFAQASNYNARPRPAEVLIENGSWRVIRKRETLDDLIRGEE